MIWESRENKEGFVHGANVPWLKEAEASSKEARGCGNQRTQETEAKACREKSEEQAGTRSGSRVF